MGYWERQRKYLQSQYDYSQRFLPRDRYPTPFDTRRQVMRARALKEAQRLLKEDAVIWDGSSDLWNIYALIFHVREKDGRYVCDCKFFGEWGSCSHSLAVQIKEKGGT